jgi:Lrp/AsnC family transcriptional regulator for asnA, asnC and gidA
MGSQVTKLRIGQGAEGERARATNRRALGSDPLNRKIIALLQQDGRMAFSTIAKVLGTSEGTVRYRVNQMTEANVLKIIGVADPVAMGNEGYALIALKLGPGADPREVSRHFESLDEVTFVLFAAGQYDIVVEAICETHADLRTFMLEHCYNRPDISAVEPMLALALYKNLMKWGRP